MVVRISILVGVWAICVFAGFPAACGELDVVSLESLLGEMIDRDAVATLAAPPFILKQASSYDRRTSDPADPQTWHANNDYSYFLRAEVNEGRREWVIMEETGPGAIVRFWLPLDASDEKRIIRIYFDGSSTPAITSRFNALISGRTLVRPPFAFIAWHEDSLSKQMRSDFKSRAHCGSNLYLPIPFAKGCKITLDEQPFYYVLNYRVYEQGTKIKSFTQADLAAVKPVIDRVGNALLNVDATVSFDTAISPALATTKPTEIAPGKSLSLDLPAGANAVRNIQVSIDPRDAPQALRSLVLQATFDDESTIWCPIGEFFGCGVRLRKVEDWWRTVKEDGRLSARWIMPYGRSARVSLLNVGNKSWTVSMQAATAPRAWDNRTLHFHASWHCDLGMKTRPMSDWNYLEVTGQGRYVGDCLTVYSPVSKWYGEGDERIYYDGAAFPDHIGTGTEDYYGYAWGMADWFSSPFLSMPRRDAAGTGDNWVGYTTTSRMRLLDNIPFKTSLKHDMEIWHWVDTKVDYAVGTFWYARPGVKSNRMPQPDQAAEALNGQPFPK